MILGSFATIRSGFKLFAQRPTRPITGGTRVIQLRDVDPGGKVLWRLAQLVPTSDTIAPFVVAADDVLFAPRSARVGAVRLERDVEDHPTAASSHFYIIRVEPGRVHSGYLTWFLNHPRTKQVLAAEDRGTHLPFLPLEAIKRLEVPLPTLPVQQHISAVRELEQRERDLSERILTEHSQAREELTWRAATSKSHQ